MLETSAPGTSGSATSRHAAEPRVAFAVNPDAVISGLFASALILVVLDVVLNVVEYRLGYHSVFGLVPLLDLNRERNLPTWFASLQLALAAVLLAHGRGVARARGDRWSGAWGVLAVGFGFMSLDEFVALHERLNPWMQQFVGNDGVLGFPWVVAAVPVVIAVGVGFTGWLKALPPRTRRQVVLAGGLYVGGAVGIEAVGAAIYRSSLGPGLLYAMTTTVEEGLELVGIACFIAALLRLPREQPARPSPAGHP